MQQIFQQSPTRWQLKSILLAFTAIIGSLALWFCPALQQYWINIDSNFFLMLNSTLAWHKSWQQICGWLNHPDESWLNLLFMLGVNLAAVFALAKNQRRQALVFVVYCWVFFQFGLLLSHFIFSDLLALERASPSLVVSPSIKLSTLVAHPVKDYSENSFPAGHTFVLIYWAGFTAAYAPKRFTVLTYIGVIALIFPRLISGAHWLSDVIFTIAISYAWLTLAIGTPMYRYLMEKLSYCLAQRKQK